jgi:predicted nucleic acid-binding Zn ribbon protein
MADPMLTHSEAPPQEEKRERAPSVVPGGAGVAPPRACEVCGAVLIGRPKRCCSAKCRAAKSRRKQAERECRVRDLIKTLVKESGLSVADLLT